MNRRSPRQFQFVALAIVVLTVAIRLPSLLHPKFISGEGMYSIVASEIVDGRRLYIATIRQATPEAVP